MDRLAAEITDVNVFLVAQKTVLGVGVVPVIEAQCIQLANRISSAAGPVSTQQGTTLTQVIEKGPWDDAQKTVLLKAVSDRLLSDMDHQRSGEKRRCNQRIKSFQEYFRQVDLDVVCSDVHVMTKVQCMVELCWKVGLIMPDEASIKHIVTVGLAAAPSTTPTPSQKTYDIVQEFKALLRHKNRGAHVPPGSLHLEQYPGHPRELPPVIFNHCYATSPPVGLRLDAAVVQSLAETVIMRKSSKQIRGSSSSSSGDVAFGSEWIQQAGVQNLMNHIVSALMPPHARPKAPVIQFFPNARHAVADGAEIHYPAASTTAAVPSPILALAANNPPAAAIAPVNAHHLMTLPTPSNTPERQNEQHAVIPSPTQNLFNLPPLPDADDITDKPACLSAQTQSNIIQNALAKRKCTRKEQKDMSEAQTVMKRPAAKSTAAKRPASSMATTPVMPLKQGLGAVHYNGGKILRSDTSKSWRVFVNVADRCDKKVLWNNNIKASWQAALNLIDDNH